MATLQSLLLLGLVFMPGPEPELQQQPHGAQHLNHHSSCWLPRPGALHLCIQLDKMLVLELFACSLSLNYSAKT